MPGIKPCIIKTGRLVLKRIEDEDREPLLRMAADERIVKTYMIPDFVNQAQADAFFRRMQTLSDADTRFVYGIHLDGVLIGFLNDCELDGTKAELGYFIDPSYWNRGYATEALRAAIAELFRMGYKQVAAGYFDGNAASRRVMEKSGMHPTQDETVIVYRGASRRCLYCVINRDL